MSDQTPTPNPYDGSTPPPPPGGPAVPPPPPSYPVGAAPSYPASPAPSNGIGTAALVMGILQFFCLGTIGSILAVVFGRIGINKARRGEATNEGTAKAGFWLGIVGLILTVIGLVVLVILVIFGAKAVNESIDPAVNARTGLPDGSYTMDPRTSLRIGDRCSFSGPVEGTSADGSSSAGASEVRVAGGGRTECGSGSGTPSVVSFTVERGVARIVGVQ